MKIEEFMAQKDEFIQKALSVTDMINVEGLELDADIKHIKDLDIVVENIQGLASKGLLNDTAIWNVSVCLGTLLGEMIINSEGDLYWAIRDDMPVVELSPGKHMSPLTKIEKMLLDEDGSEGTPSEFYEGYLALRKLDSMTDEEKEKITVYI